MNTPSVSHPQAQGLAVGRWLITLLMTLVAASANSADQPLPDGSGSSLDCTASVRERDLMSCTLKIVRGAVDRFDTPAGADWKVTLPPQALFADAGADADAEAIFDPERRVLQGHTGVAPGGVSTVRFRLITAPGTNGTRLTVRASIAAAQPTYLSATAEVEARRHPDEAGTLGALRVTTAGKWVFGFLLTGLLFIGACAWLGGRQLGVLGLATRSLAGLRARSRRALLLRPAGPGPRDRGARPGRRLPVCLAAAGPALAGSPSLVASLGAKALSVRARVAAGVSIAPLKPLGGLESESLPRLAPEQPL